ncbi:MAG: TIGR01777 family oxidoreductase [Bacteroidota bacterium]
MPLPNKVLITGATGMLARRIAAALSANGTTVVALSRSSTPLPGYSATFQWNPAKGEIDSRALDGVDAIVHLAGAGIADKKWSAARKKEIIDSRVSGSHVLADALLNQTNQVRTVVNASATGFYGDCKQTLHTESDRPGNGFLAETCIKWEQALERLGAPERRNVILRIGFVIDRADGALPVMARPVRFFVGAPYGTGKQFLSWIDSADLVRLFLFALENQHVSGTYNAVAPTPVSNRDFIRSLGKAMQRPVWPIAVPSFVFRTLLGEQADLILQSQYASSKKILDAGFRFDYPELSGSLHHHLKKS